MRKNTQNRQNDYEDFDENDYEYRASRLEHRKQKRMSAALKTKNIDRLLELDDEY